MGGRNFTLTMLLQFFLLFILVFRGGGCGQPDEVLKIGLSEILKVNITTCEDMRSVFEPKSDPEELNGVNITADVFHYITTLMQDYNDKSEPNKFSPKLFFGNNTKAGSLIVRIFEKLVDIKTAKLSKLVLALEEQKKLNSGYYLLNAFDVIYGQEPNVKRRKDLELFLTTKLLSNMQTGSKSGSVRQANHGYFQKLSDSELRSHAKALICAFHTLANLTNNYAVAELLETFEAVLQDFNISKSMLIFINKFLIKAMEENEGAEVVFKALFMNYIQNRLESVAAFNKSELDAMQNLGNDQLGELKRTNPQGMLTLALDWRLRMLADFNKSSVTKYFCIMDETFRQAVKSRNDPPAIGYRMDEDNRRSQLQKQIQNKINETRTSSRTRKLLDDMKKIINASTTSVQLLEFMDACLDHIRNSSKPNIMLPLYNYVTNMLKTLGPVNENEIIRLRDKKVEELAAILDEQLQKEPSSIITMALDWLLDFKIQFITKSKVTSLFDILHHSFEDARKRRQERMKINRQKPPSNTVPRIPAPITYRAIQLSPEDEYKVRVAMGI